MSITLTAFTPIEDTLFLTYAAKALDNRVAHPILGDAMTEEIVENVIPTPWVPARWEQRPVGVRPDLRVHGMEGLRVDASACGRLSAPTPMQRP